MSLYRQEDKKLFWFTLVWFLFMMFLSHQPGPATAKTSGMISLFIARLLSLEAQAAHEFIRHAAHVGLYFVLAVSLGKLLYNRGYGWLFIFSVLAAIAIGDEGTKPLIAGRHCHIDDIGLNCLGNVLGLGLLFLGLKYWDDGRP